MLRRLLVTCVCSVLVGWSLQGFGQSPTESTDIEELEEVYCPPLDHGRWDRIVSTYVTEDGWFDYDRLNSNDLDLADLDAYLLRLQTINTYRLCPDDELALWLNAYNALVVRQVTIHYPFNSVFDVQGFFDVSEFTVANQTVTLNDIENDRIREEFNEPRVHFALVSASRGGPTLRPEAYVGLRLDEQLEDQTLQYLRGAISFHPIEMEVELSRLFEWFSHDFDGVGGVREFIASRVEQDEAVIIRNTLQVLTYRDYDWRLNEP